MSSIDSRTRVVAKGRYVDADIRGETVVLSLQSGKYLGFDPVGSRVWKLVQTCQLVSQIRDELVREFEVTPERCEADLLKLLVDMHAEGLIEVADDIGS